VLTVLLGVVSKVGAVNKIELTLNVDD